MRKINLLFSILFITQIVFGQGSKLLPTENVQIGKPYLYKNEKVKQYFSYEGGMLAVKASGGRVTIQTYDTDKLTLKKVKSFTNFPAGFVFEDCIELKGRFFLFYSNWDKNTNKQQLFAREIDLVNCDLKGEKSIFNIEGKIKRTPISSFANKLYPRRFKIITSLGKTNLAIIYIKSDVNSSGGIECLNVFDVDLNIKWEKEEWTISSSWPDYIIDSQESIYSFTDNYLSSNISKNINITKYDANLNWVSSLKTIKLRENTMGKGKVIEVDRVVMYSGGYTNFPKKSLTHNIKYNNKMNGIFYVDLTNWYKSSEIHYFDIPLKLINENISRVEINKNIKNELEGEVIVGMGELNPLKIERLKDGSLIFFREERSIKEHSNQHGDLRPTFYYKYLLVSKVNKEGEHLWIKKLPRKFYSANKYESTISFIQGNKNDYIVYIDNIKNLNPTSSIPLMQNGSDGYLSAFSINKETGNFKKVFLFETKKINKLNISDFKLSKIVSKTKGEFIFEVYKKKKEDVLIKVKLD
ncbi:MAG: hypothetical protein COB15_02155 [Flavobacteriales bacterium]|nr:MAG: hypothetical protein COB15_02155 [Flavobacteriales bacterium]